MVYDDAADSYFPDYLGGDTYEFAAGDVAPYGGIIAIPTKNGRDLDRLNAALRASPGWRRFMVPRFGNASSDPLDPFPPPVIRLSGAQRDDLRRDLERAGFQFPNGMEIDRAGNFNQNQGFWAHWYFWGPAIAAAALLTMGAAGYGPLAAALGQSTATAASAGVLPSSSLVTGASISSGIFAAPAAITSGAVSAGVGVTTAGLLASAQIPGLFGAAAPAIASQGISGTVSTAGAIAAAGSRATSPLSNILKRAAAITAPRLVSGRIGGTPIFDPAPAQPGTLTAGIGGDSSMLILGAFVVVAAVVLSQRD